MEKNINIVEILKDKPVNTKLYSLIFGDVYLSFIGADIVTVKHHGTSDVYRLNAKLYDYDEAEPSLFPSKEMRDWSKFPWKKGDVLVNKDGDVHIIFERFADDTYCSFVGKYYLWKENNDTEHFYKNERLLTSDFQKAGKDAAQTYISTIEERLGGKLNRETLEIEKPKKKPVFELGNLYVFNEQDENGELTIIGKLIGKNESYDTLTFGNQYEIENEKFVTDQAFDLHISVHEELREATEGEAITFQEAYTIWEKSKKQGKSQPSFKPFDKVLVRDSKSDNWRANLFGYIGKDGYYRCVYANWAYCIPYAGNEHLLGTTKDVEG